uniref:HTH_Tnp_Tc3_1 domain-containing protein n=1 Tax=Heterorhabditis bacteriophora TaxID=37862 RepID=A0A1I7XC54_HETBA
MYYSYDFYYLKITNISHEQIGSLLKMNATSLYCDQ